MKRIIYIALMIATCIEIQAIPSLQAPMTILQKDSTFLTIVLRGDEHHHSYFTNDNIPVAQGKDGSFYYLLLESDKTLRLSTILAHDAKDRNKEEKDFISKHTDTVIARLSSAWTEKMERANSIREQKIANKARTRTVGEPQTYTGDKKGLVILVDFANKSMSNSNSQEIFDAMFNEVGYNKNGAVGSVHDYFYDQSYGQFNLIFDVVGPLQLENDYGYYGSNGTSMDGGDLRAGEMIAEACRMANDQVNYADYDWDGDGEVDQVYVIYAGYGEHAGAPSNTIWPHEFQLQYQECGTVHLDGVTINTYACSCELAGSRGTTLNGIGTACHEFSHCLGLPDFYDTQYNGGFGMSYWDLMSSGSHCGPNGNGEVPTGYSAYERHFAGWLEYEELQSPCIIENMPSIQDAPTAYILYNDNNENEYFLLENRQNEKWYSYVGDVGGCHGLLITHVDYSETNWRNNRVNTTPKHQRMTIVPADASYGSTHTNEGKTYYSVTEKELKGDLFPGLLDVTEFTNLSHDMSGGRLFNLNTDGTYNLNKPVTRITETNGLISFYFMGGIYIPTPEIQEATNITASTFTANWKEVENADNYSLELSTMKAQSSPFDNVVLSEDFAKFKTGKNTADGYTDLSDDIDRYMQHKGWKGQKIYTSQYGVKIGITTTNGYLTTPLLKVNNSNLTVRFTAKAPTSAGATIQFIAKNLKGEAIEMQACKLYYQSNRFIVNFENIEDPFITIQITSPERLYLTNIVFYDGLYTETDFKNAGGVASFIGTNTKTYNGIIGTKMELSELTESYYRYRVRANKDGAQSGWSEYQEVDISNSVGIEKVTLGTKASKTFYDLQGRKVNIISMSGAYIMKDENGTTRKVIIK